MTIDSRQALDVFLVAVHNIINEVCKLRNHVAMMECANDSSVCVYAGNQVEPRVSVLMSVFWHWYSSGVFCC
ncbi:Protein of unknown function [Leuconostoc citreum LBAE E16]|nr:Protein of unknown function [Leuconostoc citreum LBAE E16]